MGDQARGSCDDENAKTDVVIRWIADPVGFQVEIEIDDAGVIHALGVEAAHDVSRFGDVWQVDRALTWVLQRFARASIHGELAADVLAELPLTPAADIERAMVTEIDAVQRLRLNGALGGVI